MVSKIADMTVPLLQGRVAPSSLPKDPQNQFAVRLVEVAAPASTMAVARSQLDYLTEACTDQYEMQQADPDSPKTAELEKS